MDNTSVLLNFEARKTLSNFLLDLIETNQVPVYMVKNLLLEAVYNLNVKEQEEYQKAVEEYKKQQQTPPENESQEE